jgi:spermidine synthase
VREDGGVLTLARSVSERGELVLLRRADSTLELRVNGLFAMDTAETTSERLLASRALESVDTATVGLSVLVGGLGLGFTVAALLDDPRVARVVVAEIEPDLVRWHRDGIVPSPTLNPFWAAGAPHNGSDLRPASGQQTLLDDPRVEVVVADVGDFVVAQKAQTYDLVLLDVDNGPGFLLYDRNAAIYREPFLTACRAALRPGGSVAIWSAGASASLADAVGTVFGTTEVVPVSVNLNERRTHYHLYLGRTPRAGGR